MNEKKRKIYDSTLSFDDTIPQEPIDPDTFIQTFGPVFARNAIWSRKEPVPVFGNEETPYKQVERFYKFW